MDNTKNTGKFVKTRHRPWEKKLLEEKLTGSISNESLINDEGVIEASLSKNYADQKRTIEKQSQSIEDKSEIVTKINDIEEEPILIGGIFRPHLFITSQTDHKRNEVTSLIENFNRKNAELATISNDLKILEAQEQAQKAEQAKAAEERLRHAAESKVQEVIQQVQEATKELHLALQNAQDTEVQRKKETTLRKELQIQLEEIKLAYESQLEDTSAIAAQREKAELKAKQAVEKVIELESTIGDQENKYNNSTQELQEHLQYVENELSKSKDELVRLRAVEQENSSLKETINDKERAILDLTRTANEKASSIKQEMQYELDAIKKKLDNKEVNEVNANRENKEKGETINTLTLTNSKLEDDIEKLKDILKTERELRKNAELKILEAKDKITLANKQKQLAQHKAKQAINRANQTIMSFIKSPLNQDDNNSEFDMFEEDNDVISGS